jgi:hypothetical protein
MSAEGSQGELTTRTRLLVASDEALSEFLNLFAEYSGLWLSSFRLFRTLALYVRAAGCLHNA